MRKNSLPRCAFAGWHWLAAGDGGDEKYAVAVFQRGRLAVEEPDVFLVEIDIEKLADLALLVANVARERRKLRGQVVQRFGDCGCAAIYFGRTLGEASKCCWDFYRDCHGLLQSFRCGMVAGW